MPRSIALLVFALISSIAGDAHSSIQISVSRNDLGDPYVQQWNPDLSSTPSSWNSGDGSVSDIAIDPVTGDLYALTQSGIRKQISNGGFQNLGLISAGYNNGGDIEVYDGVISVSYRDSGDSYVRQWDTNKSNAYTVWNAGNSYVADISVDPTTGDLYAFTNSGIRRQTSTGGVQNLGLISAYPNWGGDIEVYGGVISVSLSDFQDHLVRQWDTNNSNAYTVWNSGSYYVADIGVDPITGDLYAFTYNGIRKQTPTGGLEVLGLISAAVNYGGDIEVYSLPDPPPQSTVPEALSFTVWLGLASVAAFSRSRGRA